MQDRDAIIRKLNALRDLANHPSTEPALVESAIRKFNKLMQEYNLTLTDLDVKAAGIGGFEAHSKKGYSNTVKTRSPMGWIVLKIAELTDTRLIALKGMNDWAFVGIPTDVQYAEWLFTLIQNSMERGAEAFRFTADFHNRINSGQKANDIVHAFKHGFRIAINKTLSAMIEEKKVAGNALIVVKTDLIDAFLKEQEKKAAGVSKSKALTINSNLSDVARQGHEEGEKVKLRKEVDNNIAGYLN